MEIFENNLRFDPDALPHVYTYNGPGGKMDTETITDGSFSWRKTYTYDGSGNMTSETAWVKV